MCRTQLIGGGNRHQLECGARLVVVGNDRVVPRFHQDVHAGAAQLIDQLIVLLDVLRQIVQAARLVPFVRNIHLDARIGEDFVHILLELGDILVARQLVGIVRIEVRQVRHRQHFAGLDIHDDAGNAVTGLRVICQRGFEVFFQIILDVAVHGQHQRVAVGRGDILLGVRHDVLVLRVLHAHDAARRAGELVVVLGFQTVGAVIVAADIAQHRRQERAVLIIALGVRLGIHTGALRCLELFVQLLGNVLIDLLCDDLVLRVGLLDLRHHGVVIDIERFGQDGRQCLPLGFRRNAFFLLDLAHDGLRRDCDALYLGRFGQCLHIRIVDLAAVGRDERVAGLQRRCLLDVKIVMEHLHIQQPQSDRTEADHHKDHGQQPDARAHLVIGSLNCHVFASILA